MKIDIVTIFPEYFAPLSLSLLGKAQNDGLIEVVVHDLREGASDRHRSVDDTPYGGGAGMVMTPEPWAVVLDRLVTSQTTLVFLTPAGQLFSQAHARTLSTKNHLVFACGRYEGIDQRVIDYYHSRCEVLELSVGDYVLNGGEVAALAIIEACVRLIPGVLGNPESLREESHEDGLVEYPSYTKPASWRGVDVPDVLLSGHHAEVAAWRRAQSRERTQHNRPDLWERYRESAE